MQTRAANSAKRARDEDLNEFSLSKRTRNDSCDRSAAPFHPPMERLSDQRARDMGQTDCSKRIGIADSEKHAPTHAVSLDKGASERVKLAARTCKRPFSPSEAARDSELVSEEAPSTLQQVSAYCFLLIDP